MFVRPCWVPQSPDETRRILKENPWALLVSQGPEGPLATNLPMLVEKPEDGTTAKPDDLVLVSHLARANDHLAALRQAEGPVLAIFEGPWSYVTASWYPDRQMPSTFYYTAVHCYGRLEFQDEPALDSSLDDLVQRMEAPHEGGWRTDEIPRSEITRRFAGIQGFRMIVSRVEAKFKLGQDEPLRDALAVADVLATHTSPQDLALARMIREQNRGRA
ncbi:MAG: FMN-binding negative transcriptional regulator [Janthinobacterium lividum]